MQKSTLTTAATVITLAIAMLLTGTARGQQAASTTTTPQQPAASAPAKPAAPKTTPGTAKAKTGQKPAAKKQAPLTLKTDKDKASYAIGLSVGKSLQRDSVDVDPSILLRGLKDGMAGGKTLLTDDEAKAALGALQAEVRKKQEEKTALAGQANQKEGEAFLAANKA